VTLRASLLGTSPVGLPKTKMPKEYPKPTQFDWFYNVVFGNHECKDLDVALHKLIIFFLYFIYYFA